MTNIEEHLQRFGRRLAARALLRSCDRVGVAVRVLGRPRIVNQGRITIGDRFRFASEPIMSHLFADSGGIIDIGDDVTIGHGTGIAARGRIRIGHGSRLGAFVLVMDTDYHVAGDFGKAAEIAPISIGNCVNIGNRVTILRGTVIGANATVLDGSVVSGVVAEGARVSGVPARQMQLGARVGSRDDVALGVRRVAQASFRLTDLPALEFGPSEIEAWDSLGTLSFLLALEEEFGVPLGEDEMRDVRTLLDASTVVSGILERQDASGV
jgi:acetyltransferase-like isoleucine patch superfamily enzyme